ncbi:MAG: hypothetical protein CL582_11885 [Alteromonadaceae bacterium]|nr:hypothetical protein [Alteromonadaceae bacterium]
MFVKYLMNNPEDYRGSVKLIQDGMAYSSVETLDDDMTELDEAEVTMVKDKTDGAWLSNRDFYLAKIDELSDLVRASHMEVGVRTIDIEYRQVQKSLEDWQKAGSPTNDVPIEIQCWADINGETLQWAVDDISSEMGRLEEFVKQLRVARLTAKYEIRNAVPDDVVSTYEYHRGVIESMKNTDPDY